MRCAFVFCFALIVLTIFVAIEARRSRRKKHREFMEVGMSETVTYLKKYGYMNTESDFGRPIDDTDDPRITTAVQWMQGFFHLPRTGKLDHRTVEIMRQPRCGYPDINDNTVMTDGRLPEQYNIAGRRYRWTKTDLSFTHVNYPTGQNALEPEQVRRIIKKAFQLWSDVTPLTFREVKDSSQEADIKIEFGRGHHHSEEPSLTSFDGVGGELAHAFTPNSFWGDLEGDIHFDDDEMFTAGGGEGFALFLVAAHEIGHSLGLAHSDDPGSLMWPNYMYYPVKGYTLPTDDILGIQEIYGPRPGSSPTLAPSFSVDVPAQRKPGNDGTRRRPDAVSSMCREDPFTALLKMDNELFAFRDNRVWRIRITDRQLVSPTDGEPAKRFWKGIPDRITAAYQRQDGNVVFFKGDKYYIYSGKRRVGRPLRISTMGVRRPPMAALRASQLAPNKAYLLRGSEVWLYDEGTGSVDAGYPRRVTAIWRDLPPGLTGGEMLNDGSALFLKGNRYFEVDTNNRVTSPRGGQSNLFSVEFLGCTP